MPATLPVVRVTEIGEFLRHQSCERRFKLEINKREEARRLPFAERLFNQLDPVLQQVGKERENDWEQYLLDSSLVDLTHYRARPADQRATPWTEFASALQTLTPGQPAFGREIQVSGQVGAFRLEGRLDFAIVTWEGGLPKLRLVECKASRRDRAYHRVQVALYRMIVDEIISNVPLPIGGIQLGPDSIQCVVARIDESTNTSQAILDLPPLSLEMETADLRRLLSVGGRLERIARSSLASATYQLDSKCDGCIFSVHCLPETARERRLELIGLEPIAVRTLRSVGIHNLDDLASLDLAGPLAAQIRRNVGFRLNLERLKGEAAARIYTLPGGRAAPDAHAVVPIPHSGYGQLPNHDIHGDRLVRIYLTVHYDYTENRVGAIAAHITKSDHNLHCGWVEGANGRREPDPRPLERLRSEEPDQDGRSVYVERPLRGKDVRRYKTSEWTGIYDQDTAAERELLQGFLHELVEAIADVAEVPQAPIHFYVWSRSEMTQLVEACSRTSSMLLGNLRELLGCRESLEQLIFSCLQEEVDQRFGLGWTGRGLSVASSLSWFGRTFHWRRTIAGQSVDLDHVFTQDIFDFKTTLHLDSQGRWAEPDAVGATTHRFEIRSRFNDSLTAPYWRAVWRTLPDPDAPGTHPRLAGALRRYQAAAQPGHFSGYLTARAHALRWMEEGVRFKNSEIIKVPMDIAGLPDFQLGVNSAAQAGIDFLRLDQHVKVTQWIASHLIPPSDRVPFGRTIPVRDVVSDGTYLVATMDLVSHGIAPAELEARCSIGATSFVRVTPSFADPHAGQTLGQLVRGGRTCKVVDIDWQDGRVTLEPIFSQATRYVLQSGGREPQGPVFEFATIDESVSDFVAGRVDSRLQSGKGSHIYSWFDPLAPLIPPRAPAPAQSLSTIDTLLRTLPLPPRGMSLTTDQREACLAGLRARVQLLQGPPGTGKTNTTAVACLTRILTSVPAGQVVFIAAHTHTAVDTLLRRIRSLLTPFESQSAALGLVMPRVHVAKVHSSDIEPANAGGPGITDFSAHSCIRLVNEWRSNAVLVIGGTTNALLKLGGELSQRLPFARLSEGFQASLLCVDEASMMVLPHFLALGSFVAADGAIMLSGDHRQLAPIIAHDWEREDRPPAVLYQPFASAYEAIQRLRSHPGIGDSQITRSALEFTFRLPPVIRELIARLYRLDNIELQGRDVPIGNVNRVGLTTWQNAWQGDVGLYLVLHAERESKQSNETEIQIIEELLRARGAQADDSIAIITPHRAQRTILQSRVSPFGPVVGVVDTVERLQGGERPTVLVSATASDPSAIASTAGFILDMNRSNVAFSRAENRLIVICSEALVDHMPTEVDEYESAMLWKSLRELCSLEVGRAVVNDHLVRVMTPPPELLEAAIENLPA